MNVERIPLWLRQLPIWVVWRFEDDPDRPEKERKVPYRVDGKGRASSTDPGAWGTFEAALAAVRGSKAHGLGIAIAADLGLVFFDLDRCLDVNGRLHPAAADIVRRLASYTERSQGEEGVHALAAGCLNGFRHATSDTPWQGKLEVYDKERFAYLTGEEVEGVSSATIERRQAEIDEIIARYLPPREARTGAPRPTGLDDEQLLAKARAAKNGALFERLWSGDWGGYGSPSEADLSLVSLLAFWTGPDPGWLDRLFRLSGLMRDKWDERRGESTYGAQTIERVLVGKREFYEPGKTKAAENEEDGARLGRVTLINPDGLSMEPVESLDGAGRHPRGMSTLLAGDGGIGKSAYTAMLAAIVTRLGGGVIFATAEDDRAKTWKPRLVAAGADLNRVRMIRLEAGTDEFAWDETILLPANLDELRHGVEMFNKELAVRDGGRVELVVIDPLEAHLSDEDDEGNSSTRRRAALAPLEAFANQCDVHVLLVHHISKDRSQRARYRILGTVANRNAARSVLLFVENPNEEREEGSQGVERLLYHEKHNVSPQAPTQLYRIEAVEVSEPGGPPIPTARIVYLRDEAIEEDDLFGIRFRDDDETGLLAEAKQFLAAELVDGERPVVEVNRNAAGLNISQRTLERARRDLGVESVRKGGIGERGQWWLRLPLEEAEDVSQS